MVNGLIYILIIFLMFSFTYIFDIKENYTMLYMFIMAPVLDYFIFLYNKKNISMSYIINNPKVEKRESLRCGVEIYNSGFLPILFLNYEFSFSNKFICSSDPIQKISLLPRQKLEAEYILRAMHRGEGEISLDRVWIKSLMGLFTSEIKFQENINKITITPAIINVKGVDGLLKLSVQDEEEDEITNNFFNGQPTHEYKEYAPGDPLNRVNWKLSSKTDKLYVRKSATDVKRKKIIIIDPVITNKLNFENEGDLIIETAISIVRSLYKYEYESELLYYENKALKIFKYVDDNSLDELLDIFSRYNFSTNLNDRFNNFEIATTEKCDYIIMTVNRDKELDVFVKDIFSEGNNVTIVSKLNTKIYENQFHLGKGYSLEVM